MLYAEWMGTWWVPPQCRGSNKQAFKRFYVKYFMATLLSRKEFTWTSSSSCPQARRHFRTASTNHWVDQITCSEHFKTILLPAKMAAMMGDQALCRAKDNISSSSIVKRSMVTRTVIPGYYGCDYSQGFEVNLRFLVESEETAVSLFRL